MRGGTPVWAARRAAVMDDSALAGSQPVSAVDLVLDGGWGGDQVLNLTSASVNGNSFTFPAAGTAVQTNSAPAVLSLINRPCLTESSPLSPRSQLIRPAWPRRRCSRLPASVRVVRLRLLCW